MANKVLSVANAFVELGLSEGNPISNMKLQKLLYFAHGHSLGLRDRPLVDEVPEAWTYGPVFPSIYQAFKVYGAGPIAAPGTCFVWTSTGPAMVPPPPVSDPEDIELINAVWHAYKDKSPIELSNMSHVPDSPWSNAYNSQYRNVDIPDDAMRTYFRPAAQQG